MKYLKLKDLQNEAKENFSHKTINSENLYEWINTNSYLCVYDNLEILKEIWNENYELPLDKGYVYGDNIIDYLNGMVATYLEKYIKENHEKRDADWDYESL